MVTFKTWQFPESPGVYLTAAPFCFNTLHFFCFICSLCHVDYHINKLVYFPLCSASKVAPKTRCVAAEKHFWSNTIFVVSCHRIKTRGQKPAILLQVKDPLSCFQHWLRTGVWEGIQAPGSPMKVQSKVTLQNWIFALQEFLKPEVFPLHLILTDSFFLREFV